jgi:hypothetical protein
MLSGQARVHELGHLFLHASLVLATGTSTNAGMAAGMDALSSTVTWADTINVYMGSWIDPDPSQWIYFGSYTSSSHPIAYTNVTGYTFVDENPWATLFDETYQGWDRV